MNSDEDREQRILPEIETNETAARALVGRLDSFRLIPDSIGPNLSGAERVAFLSDQLFDHGRLRSPIRGKFLDWRSHWRLARHFEKRARSECGLTLAEAHDAFEPLRKDIEEFTKALADFKDRRGPLTVETLFGENEPVFDPTNKWMFGLLAAKRELNKAAESFRQTCLEEWRVVRILDRNGYATLVAPDERLDDRESSEVRWIFSSDLPASLLGEMESTSEPQQAATGKEVASPPSMAPPAISLRKQQKALEREMSDWFRDEVASGANLRPKENAEQAIRAEARDRGYEIELSHRAFVRIWKKRAPGDWKRGGAIPHALR